MKKGLSLRYDSPFFYIRPGAILFTDSIEHSRVIDVRRTPVDLYRMGNSVSARMGNIRKQDIEIYDRNGEWWIAANSGGISTFSIVGRGRNWWQLDEGIEIPTDLRVVNDYGNHYLWEPSYAMPLENYKNALESMTYGRSLTIGDLFYKFN